MFCAGLLLGCSSVIHLQAFGLGVMLPGGGFLLYAGTGDAGGWLYIACALLSMALFGLSLLLWFATGNVLAPPMVWLASAAGAAMVRHDTGFPAATQLVPGAMLLLLASVAAVVLRLWVTHSSHRRRANAYLIGQAGTTFTAAGADCSQPQELSPRELQLMRFILDRALQPLANFDGFEWHDQVQTAAVRYQLNFTGYVLAMAQATRLPAFDAYLGEAQRRLIEKQTDPLCNTIGASAMLAHDRLAGTALWRKHEARFRRRLEAEFVDAAGRIVPCRSNYTGIAMPCVGGAQPQALLCFFLNAIMPDIAMRQWLLLRRSLFRHEKRADALNRNFFWRIDTGNYRFSRAAAYASTALAANELGDRLVADLCFAALDAECPPTQLHGRWYRPQASVWAHAVEFLARAGGRNAFRTLIHRPRTADGIVVSKARYPDVLCAYATSTQHELTAVFYPGSKAGQHEIELSGLLPGASYGCEGASTQRLVADAAGRATARITLSGRSVLRVRRKA
jgi:hypothetical protein